MRRFAGSTQSLGAKSSDTMLPLKSGGSYSALAGGDRRAPLSKDVLVKIFALLSFLTLAALGLRVALAPSDKVFGLMIDAGSTGSRVHTFQFSRAAPGAGLALDSEDFYAVKPGLSAHKAAPTDAAASLRPLLARARALVPAAARPATPVFLRATAGLRMVGEGAAEAILNEVRRELASSGFRFDDPSWATILGGSDEGVYSWITVNTLLDRPATDTVGTLEMGGGSAQIAFVPSDSSRAAAGNCSTPAETTLFKANKLPLYTFSNLKFGLKAARATALTYFLESGFVEDNPCINPGGEVTVPIPFDDNSTTVSLTGGGNFAACRALVDKAVTKPAYGKCSCTSCTYHGVTAPSPIEEYYAFAFYLERTIALGMRTPLTVRDIREKGEQLCRMPVAEVRKAYPALPNGDATDVCLDLSYIASHLEYGHGITEEKGTKLHVVDKIKGVELGWSLGAMMAEFGRLGISQ